MAVREFPNKQIIFKGFITGAAKESDMVLKSSTLPLQLKEGTEDVLVKNLYLSCDPYMLGRMRDYHGSYATPFTPGSVINGYGVAKVVLSNHPDFKEGDLVSGLNGWEEYSIIPTGGNLKKIEYTDVPLSYYVGVLGIVAFQPVGTSKERLNVLNEIKFISDVFKVDS